MKQKGFTLVELLVAISIMAILSAIAVVSYSGITAKARDSQRIKDLQAIKQALELYRSDVHNYPKTATFILSSLPSLTNGTTTYLSQSPKDPNNSYYYYYRASPSACDNSTVTKTCSDFILCAKREGSDESLDPFGCSIFFCGTGIHCGISISSQ